MHHESEFHDPAVGLRVVRSDGPPVPVQTPKPRHEPPKTSGLLLCFSHLRWDFVWQRPQHLMTRAARAFAVVLMEEPIWRPCEAPHLDLTERPGDIRVLVPVLPDDMHGEAAVMAQRDLLDGFLAAEPARSSFVAWYYTPMALPFSDHLRPDAIVYDNMDELSAFRGASPEMIANERALLERADVVFTGGMSLYEAKRDRHPNVIAHPSSIDRAHFAAARDWEGPEPEDQADIPHPRFGFFGVIDERMDIDLVAAVADQRPDWHLVMIGPVVKIDPATLPQRPNIHWLDFKAYADLPAYLAGWDGGLMPFALNESTRFISPTKTPEYLAAGVPLVSTPIADVVRPYGETGLVAIAATAEEAVAAGETLLRQKGPDWLMRVDRFLAGTSWDLTWSAMHDQLGDALHKRTGAQPRQVARSR